MILSIEVLNEMGPILFQQKLSYKAKIRNVNSMMYEAYWRAGRKGKQGKFHCQKNFIQAADKKVKY
jgi:hypothetical protein